MKVMYLIDNILIHKLWKIKVWKLKRVLMTVSVNKWISSKIYKTLVNNTLIKLTYNKKNFYQFKNLSNNHQLRYSNLSLVYKMYKIQVYLVMPIQVHLLIMLRLMILENACFNNLYVIHLLLKKNKIIHQINNLNAKTSTKMIIIN